MPDSMDDIIRVEEVARADFYVDDLFRRQFGGAAPDYPRHFVAWHRAGRNVYTVLGYVHCSVIDELCLTGGLVEDERAIARMAAPAQVALRKRGGILALLLRHAIAVFADRPALWAYVGEPRMRSVLMAEGFEALAPPHLLVRWSRALPAQDRSRLCERVAALGPF
jgi:hypothetical protein